MKKTLSLFLLLTSALSLMSCATGAKPQRQPVAGGEQISFPSQHISFFLPQGWKTMPNSKGEGRLLRAVHDNGEAAGGMALAVMAAPDTRFQRASDPALLKDYQRSWAAKGFTKFSKPQLVIVGGHEGLRSESQKPGANQSHLSYIFMDQGRRIVLLFVYYGMPVNRGPAVQRIVDSFSIGR